MKAHLFHVLVYYSFYSWHVGGIHHQGDCLPFSYLHHPFEYLLIIITGSQSGNGHDLQIMRERENTNSSHFMK